jgi:hypothetical protein
MSTVQRLIILLISLLPLFVAAPAYADTNDLLFSGCKGNAAHSPVCKDKDTKQNPVLHAVKVAADLFALATGAAAVVLVILGGITMITSSGNPEAIASARKRIIYALVGLVVVALAWAIVSFVVDRLIK